MRNLNTKPVDAQTNATTTFSPINANQLFSASFVAQFSDGTAAGTLKLQASNDPEAGSTMVALSPDSASWVDVPSVTSTVVAGANVIIEKNPMCFQWIRLVWTRTAGAGTITVDMNAQSV